MFKKTLSNPHTSDEVRNIRANTLFSLNNKPELITLTSFLPLVIALFLALAANILLWSELFKGGEYLAPLPTIYCAAINR